MVSSRNYEDIKKIAYFDELNKLSSVYIPVPGRTSLFEDIKKMAYFKELKKIAQSNSSPYNDVKAIARESEDLTKIPYEKPDWGDVEDMSARSMQDTTFKPMMYRNLQNATVLNKAMKEPNIANNEN